MSISVRIPEYAIIPGLDQNIPDEFKISSVEVEAVCKLLAHSHYRNLESQPSELVLRKMEVLSKPKPVAQTANVFKKHFIDLAPASKLKKGLQRITSYIYEELIKRDDTSSLIVDLTNRVEGVADVQQPSDQVKHWIEPRLMKTLSRLMQEYPSFLGFYTQPKTDTTSASQNPLSSPSVSPSESGMDIEESSTSRKASESSSVDQAELVRIQLVMNEHGWKVSPAPAVSNSRARLMALTNTTSLSQLDDVSVELLNTLLDPEQNFKGTEVNDLWVEYVILGGDIVETERMKTYFQYMKSVMQTKAEHLNDVDMFADRGLGDLSLTSPGCFLETCNPSKHSGLDLNSLTLVLSLLLSFYDQDCAGRLIADGAIPAADECEYLAKITTQLKQYEQIGKFACVTSLLMDSPVWFFGNSQLLLRVGSCS